MSFPNGFLWGAASSAYQTEGAWNEGGKGESIWDAFSHKPGNIRHGETGDIAADSYHRLDEELLLIKELGLHAYRFSISWPRIFPQGKGLLNATAFSYYDKLVDGLLQLGVTPLITLYHWDLPQALEQCGGFLNRETAHAFAEYAQAVVHHFDGRVKHYITLNEPQCFLPLGYRDGIHAPGKKLDNQKLGICIHNALSAHGEAVRAMRESASAPISIGIATTGRICCPVSDTEENLSSARAATFCMTNSEWSFSHAWLLDALCFGRYPSHLSAFESLAVSAEDWSLITQPLDFIGLNVYNADTVDAEGRVLPHPPGFPRTALKWGITPESLYYGPLFLYERYRLPLYITENGQSCNDRTFLDGIVHDIDRIDFLTRYLLQLRRACEHGVPIGGYFHWSLSDNFEWHSGYDERFGLIYVDYETKRRIPKDSAHWYASVIQSNGTML